MTVSWNAVDGAKSYVLHYGDPGKTTGDATYMEYATGTSYTLPADKVPAHVAGDKIYFYVQAFSDVGVGDTTEAQAEYLNAGNFTGSDWSKVASVTFAA